MLGRRREQWRFPQPGRLFLVGLILAALLSVSNVEVRAEGSKGVVSGSFTIAAGPPVPPPGTLLYLPKMYVTPSYHQPGAAGSTVREPAGVRLDVPGPTESSVWQALARLARMPLRK